MREWLGMVRIISCLVELICLLDQQQENSEESAPRPLADLKGTKGNRGKLPKFSSLLWIAEIRRERVSVPPLKN
jgi:hypothetical protein